jgi:vacuolar-type H+-ATPase subunit D/Vma8
MADPLTTGGAGVGGTLVGALLTWVGIKKSIQADIDKDIDKVEARIDKLTDLVQYKSTCVVMHSGVDKEFKNVNAKIDNVHADVKEILRRLPQ